MYMAIVDYTEDGKQRTFYTNECVFAEMHEDEICLGYNYNEEGGYCEDTITIPNVKNVYLIDRNKSPQVCITIG